MSILIKNMEMPKNCTGCPICCRLPYQHRDEKGRRPGCPLVEIPTPHGRLIDADKLANETFYGATSAPYITYWKFVNAPTVIEAEGSET